MHPPPEPDPTQRVGPASRAGRQREQHQQTILAQKIAQGDQATGQRRQLLVEAAEHLHDLWHHIGQQAGDDQDGDAGQQQGIEQRQPDLLAHLLAGLGVIGQPLEHHIEMTGLLAGGDGGPIQLREYLRKIAERGRQRVALQHPSAHRQQ